MSVKSNQPRGVPPQGIQSVSIVDIIVAEAEGKGKKKSKRKYMIGPDPSTWPEIKNKINLEEYREFIINLFVTRGRMKKSEAVKFTSPVAMELFVRAMTHDSVNPLNLADNYEMMEHLGDATVNKCTTWYLKNRFPDIVSRGDKGVQILSRQEALLKSKPMLARYSDKLGFPKFIQYRPLEFEYDQLASTGERKEGLTKRIVMDRSMKEDVFESFFACTEEVIDSTIGMIGVGYSICFKILSSIYNEEQIPTSLNELVDSKTKLKEIFDKLKPKLGPLPQKQKPPVIAPGDTFEYIHDTTNQTETLEIILAKDRSKPIVIRFTENLKIHGATDDAETSKKIADEKLAKKALEYLQTQFGSTYVRYQHQE